MKLNREYNEPNVAAGKVSHTKRKLRTLKYFEEAISGGKLFKSANELVTSVP